MPWKSALNNLDFFYLMFDRSEVYGPMQVCFLSAKHVSINIKTHKTLTIYSCASNLCGIITFPCSFLVFKNYLRKQVTPLFNHYKTITDNWNKVPDGHMDQ